MRFSLRALLFVTLGICAASCWFGVRYQQATTEQRILSDLEPGISTHAVATVHPEDKLYDRYDENKLIELVENYAPRAERELNDSAAARIAGAALVHLGSKYDVERDVFMPEPRAIPLAEKYFESSAEPLARMATWMLLRHHRLSEDVHSSQSCEAAFKNGFDAADPIDVYVLVTEVYSDFNYGGEEANVLENWPDAPHPWTWKLPQSAAHSYQDKIAALEQVSPTSAKAYAGIIELMSECNGEPTNEQRKQMSSFANQVRASLPEEVIFRFMIRHVEAFRRFPASLLPELGN